MDDLENDQAVIDGAISESGLAASPENNFGVSLLETLEPPAESKTTTFPDSVISSSTGVPLLKLSSAQLTVVRAPLSSGGYRCFFNFKVVATGLYHTGGESVTFRLDAKNSQLGLLQRFTFSASIGCGQHDILVTQSFSPDVYDIWINTSYGLFPYSRWRAC